MSKKVLVALAGISAAVAARVGLKAAQKRSSSSSEEPKPSAEPFLLDDYDPSRFVASLVEAIRCETVVNDDGSYDSDAFDQLAETLERRFPLVHQRLKRETFEVYGLLFTWQGTDSSLDPIVLMAHQDVVPVEEGTEEDWAVPPFSGDVVGDRIYGRGALDCKGPLVAIFEAVEYLLERDVTLNRTVHIVSGHDEEVGGRNGAKVIAAELESRGVTPWIVVDEGGAVAVGLIPSVERPVALIGIAEKGYVDVRLTAVGQGGHSSMPPADTALVMLAEAIVKVDRNPMRPRIAALAPMLVALSEALPGIAGTLAARPERAAPLLAKALSRDDRMNALQRTTMVPTILNAGVKSNVIPQSATASINVRVIPGDTIDDVMSHVESVIGPDILVEADLDGAWEPSELSSTESDGWNLLSGVVAEVFPDAVVAPWVLTGATDSRYFEGFSRDVYRFSPFALDQDALSGFHGTDEFINVADAQRAVSFVVRLISVGAIQDD